MPPLVFRNVSSVGDVLSPWFRQQHNAMAQGVRDWKALHEPVVRLLARSRIADSEKTEIIRVAIGSGNQIAPNFYEYTGSRLSQWNETLHRWTSGTVLLGAKFYNAWEMENTATRVMGGITVDGVNLTMLPVPPNSEIPSGAVVSAEKVGPNSYVFEYPNAIKVVCPR